MATQRGLTGRIPPFGSKVRLTGIFLRNTGQIAGGEGQSRWLTVECPCRLCEKGDFVAVNEPHLCQEDPRGFEDIAPEDRPKWRHINAANLEVVGAKPRACDYP